MRFCEVYQVNQVYSIFMNAWIHLKNEIKEKQKKERERETTERSVAKYISSNTQFVSYTNDENL